MKPNILHYTKDKDKLEKASEFTKRSQINKNKKRIEYTIGQRILISNNFDKKGDQLRKKKQIKTKSKRSFKIPAVITEDLTGGLYRIRIEITDEELGLVAGEELLIGFDMIKPVEGKAWFDIVNYYQRKKKIKKGKLISII